MYVCAPLTVKDRRLPDDYGIMWVPISTLDGCFAKCLLGVGLLDLSYVYLGSYLSGFFGFDSSHAPYNLLWVPYCPQITAVEHVSSLLI